MFSLTNYSFILVSTIFSKVIPTQIIVIFQFVYDINIIVSIILTTCETVTYISYIGSIILVSTFHYQTSHFQEEPQ